MKKTYLLLSILMVIISCTSTNNSEASKEDNGDKISDIQKSEIFAFQIDENIYLGVNNSKINYTFEVNTQEISYSDMGHAQLIILDKKDIYQVSYTRINSFLQGNSSTDEKTILNFYYEWEKDYQTNNNNYIFDESRREIISIDEKKVLYWTYSPGEVSTDPTKVKETSGCSFIYNDYIICVNMSITNGNNYEEKQEEYTTLYNKLIIFDKEVSDESIKEYF